MKSIEEIALSEITKGKDYWNSARPIEEELMYFLLVDRFHDVTATKSLVRQVSRSNSTRQRRGFRTDNGQ